MNRTSAPEQGKILFVDDQPLTRLSVNRLLKKFPLDVTCAGTGERALAYLNSRCFDLCILDIDLPDIDGIVIMRIVKEISPALPVIIITGGNVVDDATEELIDCEAAHLIFKPFDVSYFVNCIMGALEESSKYREFCGVFDHLVSRSERKAARTALRQKIYFSHSHFLSGSEDGLHKMLQHDLRGDAIDVNDYGIGMRTMFPLIKNHVVRFKEEMDGKIGIVKWCEQKDKEVYNCGFKFM